MGRWSSANIAAHTPGDVANAGGSGVNVAADAAPRGAASSISPEETPAARQSLSGALSPSSSIAHDDDWGAADQTGALLNRPAGGSGGGMGEFGGADKPEIPDYEEGFKKLKFDGPDLGREVLKAGMANRDAQAAGRTAHDAAMRAAGYGGPESAGTHIVSAPGGKAGHGADIPGSGWPGPGGDTPGGDDWGGVPVSSGPRDWSPTGGGSAAAGDFGGVE
jgi:hypothetical protein